MKFEFYLEKYVYMYNHRLVCTDGENRYEALCESAPSAEKTLLFWPDDFGLPPEDRDVFIEELKEWSKTQGFRCIIHEGKGR